MLRCIDRTWYSALLTSLSPLYFCSSFERRFFLFLLLCLSCLPYRLRHLSTAFFFPLFIFLRFSTLLFVVVVVLFGPHKFLPCLFRCHFLLLLPSLRYYSSLRCFLFLSLSFFFVVFLFFIIAILFYNQHCTLLLLPAEPSQLPLPPAPPLSPLLLLLLLLM